MLADEEWAGEESQEDKIVTYEQFAEETEKMIEKFSDEMKETGEKEKGEERRNASFRPSTLTS